MPSRNILRIDVADSYYHVYARGASKQTIFRDDADFHFFLRLFSRYLSAAEVRNTAGIPYEKLRGRIELLGYCLMGNHFHLLFYQADAGAMKRLMQGVMTSYSLYFNKKYDRSGQMFESRYKASRIQNDAYFLHVSRYIHLNPFDWSAYPYSSMPVYAGTTDADDWLQPERILELFPSREAYVAFVADREAAHRELESIKHQLADGGVPY